MMRICWPRIKLDKILNKNHQAKYLHTFYDDRVQSFAVKDMRKLTLTELLRWGEKPVTAEKLVKSAQYAQHELPIRLARRVQALQHLPFIVGTNPYIRQIYSLYQKSFETLSQLAPIETVDQEKEFSETLADLVKNHTDVIPILAKGMYECRRYLQPKQSADFLNRMILSRIGIRIIAEHHLALSMSAECPDENYTGIVNHKLSPRKTIESIVPYLQELCELNFGSYPDIQVDGQLDTMFPYIDVHLEYIMTELLKNSLRAVVEYGEKIRRVENPPILVTIGCGPDDVTIRIRDRGGGIPYEKMPTVWEYSYSTVDSEETQDGGGILSAASKMGVIVGTGGPMAGLGYGLPMARIYAKWAGGSLRIVSLHDHGCDIFLRLPHIGHVGSLQI